jgi:CBS domain-containing protein
MGASADTEQNVPAELREAAHKLEKDEVLSPITVRELLRYFGASRRGIYIVEEILDALSSLNLKTEPDFRDEWIDAELRLVLASPSEKSTEGAAPNAADDASGGGADNQGPTQGGGEAAPRDPTFRIGALDAANCGVISVKPDDLLSLAITRMLATDYSQLPVMTNQRNVKGIISWSSIGAGLMRNSKGTAVRDQMEKAYIVDIDEALLDALPIIVERGYVLVKGLDASITGIVTAADVSMEFKQRAEGLSRCPRDVHI